MQDIKAVVKGDCRSERGIARMIAIRSRRRVGRVRDVGVTEEHENVPNAELSGEGDGVVKERQVPAGAVRSRRDVEFVL